MNKEFHKKEYINYFKNNFVDPNDPRNRDKKMSYYRNLKMVTPLRIETNGDSTTVFWDDNTKTTVTFSDSDKGMLKSNYSAFCAAFAKRMFRSNSQIHKMVENFDSKVMDKEFEEFLDMKEEQEEAERRTYERKAAKREQRKKERKSKETKKSLPGRNAKIESDMDIKDAIELVKQLNALASKLL